LTKTHTEKGPIGKAAGAKGLTKSATEKKISTKDAGKGKAIVKKGKKVEESNQN